MMGRSEQTGSIFLLLTVRSVAPPGENRGCRPLFDPLSMLQSAPDFTHMSRLLKISSDEEMKAVAAPERHLKAES